MKINQLFRDHIPEDLFQRLLRAFGITGVQKHQTSQSFSKEDLEKRNILETIKPILIELRSYYLPCKAYLYLDNITVQKCVTILRQVSKLFGKIVVSSQKPVNQRKITFYTIRENVETSKKMHMKYTPVHIDFS